MISTSASNSILKTSSNSSLSNPEPMSIVSTNQTRTQTPSSLDSSVECQNTANYGKKCCICDKSFILRKKNLCKVCNNYVCNEHFTKFRNYDKICDFCDKNYAKAEVRKEIENELQILTQELEKTKENSNKVDREYYQKISELNRIEQDLIKIVEYHDGKKQLLDARLANENERKEKNDQSIKEYQKILEETEIAQEEMVNKYALVESELQKSNLELLNLKSKNLELADQLSKTTEINKKKISIQLLKEKLCKKCYSKVII